MHRGTEGGDKFLPQRLYLIRHCTERATALGVGISNQQVASSGYYVFCRYYVIRFLSALSALFLLR